MPNLSGDTDVFSSEQVGDGSRRAVVAFTAIRQDVPDGVYTEEHRDRLTATLDELVELGWILSLRRIFDRDADPQARVLETGFAHDHDIAGVFEAPDIDAALSGTVRLEAAGWARLFRTQWLIGPREFAPVPGSGAPADHQWGFIALWEWNDDWCRASAEARARYDEECDIAFRGDLELGVNIAGRHRLDLCHHWHHIGAWEIEGPEMADRAIAGHERVADFKFTTSRHVVGRSRPLKDLIEPRGVTRPAFPRRSTVNA